MINRRRKILFKISEDKKTDFLIRWCGLQCFKDNIDMSLIKSPKPKEFKGLAYCYSLKDPADPTINYIVFDPKKQEVRLYDENLKIETSSTYDEILGPYKDKF